MTKVSKMGRPKICTDQEVPLEVVTVRLSFKEKRMIKKVGGGIFSAGLREILEHVAKDIDFINKPRNKK